jgi:hypothetical protein
VTATAALTPHHQTARLGRAGQIGVARSVQDMTVATPFTCSFIGLLELLSEDRELSVGLLNSRRLHASELGRIAVAATRRTASCGHTRSTI